MSNLIEAPSQNFSFIGQGTNLQGNIRFEGETKIAGLVKGEIRSGDFPLSIEPTGKFEGTIYCHNLFVYGDIKGDINSTGRVILFPSSSFRGNLITGQLVIHPGACVNMDAKTEESEIEQASTIS